MTTGNLKVQFRLHDYSVESGKAPNGAGFYFDIPLDEEEDNGDPAYLDGPYPTRDEAIEAAQVFIVNALAHYREPRFEGVKRVETFDLPIKRLTDTAITPSYQTDGAAGMDLHADETVMVPAGSSALVKCGISLELPFGYEAQIRPRSGLALKHGVTVLNSPGTIDSDYRGPIGVILHNTGAADFLVMAGARIAQMVIATVERATPVEVSELSGTARGAGGFGSTGTN